MTRGCDRCCVSLAHGGISFPLCRRPPTVLQSPLSQRGSLFSVVVESQNRAPKKVKTSQSFDDVTRREKAPSTDDKGEGGDREEWFEIKQLKRPEISNSDTATCWGASQQMAGEGTEGLPPELLITGCEF